MLVGPAAGRSAFGRLTVALLLRLLGWGALVSAIFALHSGEILLVLLAPYFGALLPVPTAQVWRLSESSTGSAAGGGYLRCYTPRWF